jgi:hypothetical protein
VEEPPDTSRHALKYNDTRVTARRSRSTSLKEPLPAVLKRRVRTRIGVIVALGAGYNAYVT